MADGIPSPAETEPGPADLRDGRPIRLTRTPASAAAHSLIQAIVEKVAPFAGRVGPGRLRSLARDLGPIVGGLLHGAATGRVTNAQRGRTAAMWQQGPIGWRGFWARVGELERAGLAGVAVGVSGPIMFGGHTGRPTRLWATPKLLSMAAVAGVSLDSLADWALSKDAQRRAEAPEDASGVVVRKLPGWASAARLDGSDGDIQAAGAGVRRLNESLSDVTIQGCTFPQFERLYLGDLRLHGRIYVKGATDNFQNAPRAERPCIRLDGNPVCEVDATASMLSVFLATTGRKSLPPDPYAIDGLPRGAVKACAVQTLGRGGFLKQWARGTDAAVRQVPLGAVRAALCAAYPELSDLAAVLPMDLREAPPPKGVQWAAGQRLVAIESEILSAALSSLNDAGVVALPIFDGLIPARVDINTLPNRVFRLI